MPTRSNAKMAQKGASAAKDRVRMHTARMGLGVRCYTVHRLLQATGYVLDLYLTPARVSVLSPEIRPWKFFLSCAPSMLSLVLTQGTHCRE